MNRRAFHTLAAFNLGLPLFARAAYADETERRIGRHGERSVDEPRAASEAEQILARVEAFYQKVTTFETSFRQYFSRGPYSPTPSMGSLFFERPAKLSFRFANGDRVVADSAQIQVYQKQSKQMFVQNARASQLPLMLSFLTAQGRLAEMFEFTKRAPRAATPVSSHVLIGKPLQPSAICEFLSLDIDIRTDEVRRVTVGAPRGTRVRYDFGVSVRNARIPLGEFELRPPPGTSMVHA